jgi:hypothetical protein
MRAEFYHFLTECQPQPPFSHLPPKAILDLEPEPLLVVATEVMYSNENSLESQDIDTPDASGATDLSRSEDTFSSSSGPPSTYLDSNERMKLKAEFSAAYEESLEIGSKMPSPRTNQ